VLEGSITILEASSRFGVVRVSELDTAKIINITHLDFNDYEIRVRLKLNGKFYVGHLELSE
tara:strand:- start:48 stop:230 length:183 start_codon:yes stop_codon:yes gene_type:complete